jgi:hypothetical protein
VTGPATGTDADPAERAAGASDGGAAWAASDDAAAAGLTMVGGTAPGCVGDACTVPGAEAW